MFLMTPTAPPREPVKPIRRSNSIVTCLFGVVVILGALSGIAATTIATERNLLTGLSKETIGAIIALFVLFLAIGVGIIFAGLVKSVERKL